MNYEHEITFNNNELYYLTSTTNYLNNSDKQFLIDENININNIIKFKSLIYINIVELKNKKTIINLLNSSKLNKYSLN